MIEYVYININAESIDIFGSPPKYKKGVRVIVNFNTTKDPEYYVGTVSGIRSGLIYVTFDDGDKHNFKPTRSLVGLVGITLSKKKRKTEIPAKDIDKWLDIDIGEASPKRKPKTNVVEKKAKFNFDPNKLKLLITEESSDSNNYITKFNIVLNNQFIGIADISETMYGKGTGQILFERKFSKENNVVQWESLFLAEPTMKLVKNAVIRVLKDSTKPKTEEIKRAKPTTKIGNDIRKATKATNKLVSLIKKVGLPIVSVNEPSISADGEVTFYKKGVNSYSVQITLDGYYIINFFDGRSLEEILESQDVNRIIKRIKNIKTEEIDF